MSSGSDDGELSPEEKELIALQTEMLRAAQMSAADGAELNKMLTPILLEQAGYDPVYETETVRNPEYDAAKAAHAAAKQKLIDIADRVGLTEHQAMNMTDREIEEYNPHLVELRHRLKDAHEKRESIEKNLKTAGEIIGINAKPKTEAQKLREQNEQLLLERQNAGLRGELPVNPALLSSLEDQEEELRASLLKNLGTGYETSSPGIEALAEFGERKEAVMEASRRDDIAGAGGLANEMGSYLSGLQGRQFEQGQSVVGSMFGEASTLAGISQGYTSPLDFLSRERHAGDGLTGGQQAGVAAIGYGAQTGNPYIAGAGALAYLFLD